MPSAACTVVRVVNCPMILTLIGAEVGQMLVVLGTGCVAMSDGGISRPRSLCWVVGIRPRGIVPVEQPARTDRGADLGEGRRRGAEQEERERDECDHPTHGRASLLHVRPPATCDPGRCGSR